jgi:hypothetical protein
MCDLHAHDQRFDPLDADEYGLDSRRAMGGGIDQWLVFRAADRSLSRFTLVVPWAG